MRTIWQDLQFGLRLFLRSPGFTAVAVLTLALGIAANITVFSWIDGLLLRPFPGARDSHQLAVLEVSQSGAPNGANQTSYLDYRDYRANLKSLAGLAVHREEVFSLGNIDSAQAVWGELVSGNYFEVLGVKPSYGRVFTPDEDGDKLGAYPVAVISQRVWLGRFQGDPRVVGKSLRVNQRELTVVGVAPAEFRGTIPGLAFDIWIPVTMGKELGLLDESAFRNRGERGVYAVARLKPGVGVAQASAEAATFARNLETTYPKTNLGVNAGILPAWRFHGGAPQLLLGPLRILMAISALVLLIVCSNVANLLLARSIARRKELSIRLAVGAYGSRLCRQLLTETLLLAIAGAAVGLLLASWMADLLPALIPKVNAPIALGFQPSGRVMVFTILTCVLATVLSGAAPALFWLRSDVNKSLKEGGRSGSQGAHSDRIRSLLVVAEVTMATVALIGAGLFVRSFHNAREINPGFDRNHVVLARFYMGGADLSTTEMQQFCLRLRDRLRSNPAITDVSYANYAPLGSPGGPWASVDVEGYTPALGESTGINEYLVAPGYFDTLRIPLLQGRDFKESDDANTPPVVIVIESFTRRYFHGSSPLGRKIRFFGDWATVVGLAKDSKYFNIAETPRPHFFAPFRQRGGRGNDQQLYFFVKSAGEPAPVFAALRREVAAAGADAVAFDAMPLVEWTEVTLLPQKVAASLLAALGVVALLLAAVGLYSVMAYAVSQRSQEIGIRMALGAPPRGVLSAVLWRGAVLAGAGLVVGITAALAAMRLVAGMLVNVSATDPATFAGAALFLMSVALLASYIPARRATRVDPITVLRCE
jgi:predicted permease